jgi:hypothetical protein
VVLLLASAVLACDAPYTREALSGDVGAAQQGLREMDDVGFGAAVRRLEAGLGCLDAVLTPATYAASYRMIGAASWLLRDDGVAAGRWFRAALELDPRYDWDVGEIPLSHPMRRAWETERPAADDVPEPVTGMTLAAGAWRLDGRPITAPAATAARPHLLQRQAEDGAVTSWAIYGNAFPPEALGAPAPTVAGSLPEGGFGRVEARRERPPAKTPLLVAGIAGVVAAGGVYGASWASRQQFDAATTTDEVHRGAALTDGLVLGSGGLFVAGVVVGGWAIAL